VQLALGIDHCGLICPVNLGIFCLGPLPELGVLLIKPGLDGLGALLMGLFEGLFEGLLRREAPALQVFADAAPMQPHGMLASFVLSLPRLLASAFISMPVWSGKRQLGSSLICRVFGYWLLSQSRSTA
jgi:hypothetical protein